MSVDKSFSTQSKGVVALGGGAKTSDTTGVNINLKGWYAQTFYVDIGAWTDGTHTIALEASDDGSTWTDVPATDIVGTPPVIGDATLDGAMRAFDYKGLAKNVRVKTTVAGATTGATYQVFAVLHHPDASNNELAST